MSITELVHPPAGGSLRPVVYLDHAATTPLLPEVRLAMVDALDRTFGNPANTSHELGRAAGAEIEIARARVARLLSTAPEQVTFTSGATEANNLAIRGIVQAARAAGDSRRVVLASSIEHRSVLAPLQQLAEAGQVELRLLPVTAAGTIDLDVLPQLVDEDVLLACVQLANNEVGTLQPVAEVTRRLHARGGYVLCDATQAIGKVRVDLRELRVDFLSLSAHKFHGPKGAGALVDVTGTGYVPQLVGGGQERGARAGTPNVPAIIGMGVAAARAQATLDAGDMARVERLRDLLEARLLELDPRAWVNGGGAPRLPGISNLTFTGRDGGELVAALPTLALSRGSACSTGSPTPSHVLRAMGLSPEEAFASLRISIGATTTEADVLHAIDAFSAVVDPHGRMQG